MTYKTRRMSCGETTAKVLKNELTIIVTTLRGPNLPCTVNISKHTHRAEQTALSPFVSFKVTLYLPKA